MIYHTSPLVVYFQNQFVISCGYFSQSMIQVTLRKIRDFESLRNTNVMGQSSRSV